MIKMSEIVDAPTKKRLKVLDKNETRRERIWAECVADAKKIMETRQALRWEIVRLAEKCCVIHHGGKPSSSRYTLRNFAKEIGVAWGTFYEWYSLKKNLFDNLPEEEQKKVDFAELRYLNKNMANAGVRTKDKFTKKAVLTELKKIRKKSETTVKMEKYVKHIKTIHWNVTNKLMIKDCDPEVLGEICHLARGIVAALAKYDRKV